MENLFIRKLSSFHQLSQDDERALAAASSDVRFVPAHQLLVRDGETPGCAHAVLQGFACRFKLLPDGRRQILDFLVPGDLCDGHALFLAAMDHNVGTLSPCRIAYIPHRDLIRLTDTHPAVARSLWWSTLAQESVAREWIANVGARPADQRLAHLLCELCQRLRVVGLVRNDSYELPITQLDLADALGLSVVHTNRMLQRLRGRRLIALAGGLLTIRDLVALEAYCAFDARYLHLRHAPAECSR